MSIYRLRRGVSRALARMSVVPKANIGSHDCSSWQRRLLLARGQQIHTASVERADRCAIAILDPGGIVISWHDHLPRAGRHDHGVLSRHMSQFYLPEDVALYLPARHLSIATAYGMDTQRGWRRRPGGEIFWGVTVIQSILSDGELLGYSHVTRLVRGPAQYLPKLLQARRPPAASLAVMAS